MADDCKLGQLGTELFGDPAPLSAGRFAGDDAPALSAGMRQDVAHEVSDYPPRSVLAFLNVSARASSIALFSSRHACSSHSCAIASHVDRDRSLAVLVARSTQSRAWNLISSACTTRLLVGPRDDNKALPF